MRPFLELSVVPTSLALGLVAAGLLVTAGPARAMTEAEAAAKLNEGVGHAEKGHFSKALAVWLEIQEDVSAEYQPIVQLNIGAAYEQVGRLEESWHHFGRYLEHTPGDADTAAHRKEIGQKLEGSHRRVLVRCTPASAVVRLSAAGRPYACPLKWWFRPGDASVRVEDPSDAHEPADKAFFVDDAQVTSTIEVALTERASEPAPPLSAGPTEPADTASAGDVSKKSEPSDGGAFPTDMALLGGGGALMLTGGGLFLWSGSVHDEIKGRYPAGTAADPISKDEEEAYDKEYEADVAPKQLWGGVLLGVGTLAAITGGVLLALGGDADDEASAAGARWFAAPVALDGGGGAILTGRF